MANKKEIEMVNEQEQDMAVDGEVTSVAETTDETAIAVRDETAIDTPQAFVPTSREQVELVAQLNDLRSTLESGIENLTKPGDLAESGTVFDIVDCFSLDWREGDEVETKIMFQLVERDTGIAHNVMQSNDSAGVRMRYAQYFSVYKAASGQVAPPLENFRFRYTDKVFKAGNRAVILERVKPALTGAAS